ncbi:hypothetical protein ACJ2A9_04160 [Anaerobacillus sp. MEB173]|uniref:hypothetical protein n=1 Tax=Anaerobacillus sp. MEB173 TaxID=3383345 RepID=UPI003F8FE290
MSTTKQKENQELFGHIDTIWDFWLNSVSNAYSSQSAIENNAVHFFGQQNELWAKTRENIELVEKNLQNTIDEIRKRVQESAQAFTGEQKGYQWDQWSEQLNDIAARIEQIALTPGQANIKVIKQSIDQMEKNTKEFVSQQQQNREEIRTLFDQYFLNVRDTQKGMLQRMNQNTTEWISAFKL